MLDMLLLLFSVFIGVLGFMVIEDFSAIEAFYMAIITLTTVGLDEVKPL
jgi:voltage-gated potassium channel